MAVSLGTNIARPISSALSAPLSLDDCGKLNALGLIGPSEPAAPTNRSAPLVFGHASDGSTMTSTTGSWSGYPTPTYAYQWKADAGNVGSNQNTYVTQAGDIGKSITCTVTATNTEGSAAQASNGITVTTSAAPANTVAPVVSGSQPAGSTMTTTNGTWTGNPAVDTYSYQWKADAGNVGADQATYVTQAGDVGKAITCTVTATNRKGSTAQASNGITVTAALTVPANTVAPVVSGAQIVGSTMTSTTGTWTGNPTPTYSYQWKSAGTNVGTDQNTYVSQSSDASKSITCVVTATNSQGSASQSSNGISMSALAAPSNTVAPAISGDTDEGSTLTSTTGTWTGNPTPTYAYQWKADSTNVGTNQNTYVTQAGDVGKSVTCTVTATNSQGNSSQASNGITVTESDPDAVIEALFTNNEQGAWYDPSDLTTMFQDRAGTTQVTADGQTVGLILDKSKGLVIGSELSPAISTWNTQTGVSKSGETLVFTNAPLDQSGYSIVDFDPAKRYKITFRIASISSGSLSALLGNYATKNYDSPGTYVLFTTADASDYIQIQSKSGSTNAVVDLVSVKEIAGNHATAPSDAARPLYKTSGGLHWLQFDGVDDSLVTSSFAWGTNKSTVVAGILNNNSSAFGLPFVFGSNPLTDNGSFGSYVNIAANGDYSIVARGSSQCYLKTVGASIPRTDVATFAYDLSQAIYSDSLKLRLNAASASLTFVAGGNLGGGDFGTYPINIGRRGDGQYLFVGNIYSLVIRGALSTTQEITDTETWVNGKTGAY